MSTHDSAGNLTYDGVHQYTYDAWNRLVKVTKAWRDNSGDGSGGVTLGSIETGSVVMAARYDGLGRRIVKEVKNSADLDMTYHYYHRSGSGGQVIETRDGSDLPIRQYVWSLGYVDELVQIAMNDDPTDDTEGDGTQALCESTYYALHNANYNVQLVVDDAGVIAERYEYSPYGRRQVYFSPGTNDPGAHAPTSMSRRWSLTGGGPGAPGSVHPYGLNPRGHQGLNHDEHARLIHNRARTLHTRLGRFMQRDPLGYVDGMSLYQLLRSSVLTSLDPSGLGSYKKGEQPPRWAPNARQTWKSLKANYNTHARKRPLILRTNGRTRQLIDLGTFIFPAFSDFLDRYRKNSGGNFTIPRNNWWGADMQYLYEEERSAIQKDLQKEAKDILGFAKKNSGADKAVMSGTVSDSIQNSSDWSKALGKYRWWVKAQGIRGLGAGGACHFTMTFNVRDIYDFSSSNTNFSFGVIPIGVSPWDLRQMHLMGVYQSYKVEGAKQFTVLYNNSTRNFDIKPVGGAGTFDFPQ